MDGSVEGHHRLAGWTNSRRRIDGREFEQADQCKRIFGKGLGEPRQSPTPIQQFVVPHVGLVKTFVVKP
jgi:hypothetical protein